MRHFEISVAVCVTFLVSMLFPRFANAQYTLDRLFLDTNNRIPLHEVISFSNAAEVADFYGMRSMEASLASDFFAGYNGSAAHMLFARFPVGGGRAHLYGANVSGLTLPQLQSISGSLSLMSQGYRFSAPINLSAAPSLHAAATMIENALNANLPVGAVTRGSTIRTGSALFIGSIAGPVLYVSQVSSGSIQIGSVIEGPGVRKGTQVVSQISGSPNGAGTYAIFYYLGHDEVVPSTSMMDTYGVLTVGSVTSGTVAVGQEVNDPTGHIYPYTAIQSHLSGEGAGSAWVVNKAQTAESRDLIMTAAPLSVQYRVIHGFNSGLGSLWIQQNGSFTYASSSMTYAQGTAAGPLGLTRNSGAQLSTPGKVVTSPSAWLNEFTSTISNNWHSFQTTFDPDAGAMPPHYKDSLAAWAQSTNGGHTYLGNYFTRTPPIAQSQ
jgi:hypothetical protein